MNHCHIGLTLLLALSTSKSSSQYLGNILQQALYDKTVIPDTNIFLPEYDFIIIGAGSGGSVLAHRLTENKEVTVLLIEAGDQEDIVTDVPLAAAYTEATRYNWNYKASPTPNACRGLQGGVCSWPKGRAIGGTSVINFMVYTRGSPKDYDEWAEMGNYGWSYNEVLPYFKKWERIGIPQLYNSSYHGKYGPQDVQYARYYTELLRGFLDAGRELGYNVVDLNGKDPIGFQRAQAFLRDGRRCSSGKAFINPIINRKNLHITMRTWATKIVIDPATKTAIGVEFLKNRKQLMIRAKKEVLLSAGAIASPQLLMLSGVGPKEHLEEMGIPVIADLKVGYNLQDHVSLWGLLFTVTKPVTVSGAILIHPASFINYMLNSIGPYTLPGGSEALAFVNTNTSVTEYPNVEIVMGPGTFCSDLTLALPTLLGFTRQFTQYLCQNLLFREAFGLVPVLLRPKSRGRISLRDRNPFHWPKMEPNYLDVREDMENMIAAIKMILKIADTKSLKKYGTQFHTTPFLGCEHLPFKNDQYWECCLRNIASSLQHQSGTCKMGPKTDPDAVVDPELKVHNVKNLRVVDASIMPKIIGSHTNGPILMIGEKAADMVKSDWNLL